MRAGKGVKGKEGREGGEREDVHLLPTKDEALLDGWDTFFFFDAFFYAGDLFFGGWESPCISLFFYH